MLMGMGWTQDSGLGPTGAGRVEPVATVLKTDRAGVGAQTSAKPRVTHFPDEQQQRLARKRKQEAEATLSQAERKVRRLQDQQRDRALGRELYGAEDLDGYEEFFQ
ncbi:hypothetical protein PybrP1_007812 [[Pythium] brassicae (nom. inval.)]|nr:hypothetical protein PybrP1_007812 [[Pythium] brassicae (nom. inval.)]